MLLADEPTGNLDEKNKNQIVQLLRRLANGGVSVVMVTHDERYAEKYADRIIHLLDGRIVKEDANTPAEDLPPLRFSDEIARGSKPVPGRMPTEAAPKRDSEQGTIAKVPPSAGGDGQEPATRRALNRGTEPVPAIDKEGAPAGTEAGDAEATPPPTPKVDGAVGLNAPREPGKADTNGEEGVNTASEKGRGWLDE
jgi:ABC-type proline/glycine betaine transport system ATPase subunit